MPLPPPSPTALSLIPPPFPLSANQGSESGFGRKQNKKGGLQSKVRVRGHWRPIEDAKLRELVAQFGPHNWNLIAQKLEGRSGKSCRLRWFNQLHPRINRKPFTEEEEERLIAAHRAQGNKWAMIARRFPGRTDNAVKNHWHVMMARNYRKNSNVYRKRKSVSAPPSQPNNSIRNSESTISESAGSTSATDLSMSSPPAHCLPTFQQLQPFGFHKGKKSSFGSHWNTESYKAVACSNNGEDNKNDNRSGNLPVQVHLVPFFDFLGVGAT